MATNDYILHKMNSSSDWEEKVFTAEANKVIGFNSSFNPINVDYKSFSVTTGTSLSLDWTAADYFVITISGNGSISFSNKAVGVKYVLVINSAGASSDVAMPNTSGNVYANATESIAAGKAKEISAIYDGTNTIWVVTKELTVAS